MKNRYCDGVTRRDAIRVGAATGLSLATYLRMADAGQVNRQAVGQSAIFINLVGGPSHLDTFDPKPQAAREIRGEFAAIPTRLDGLQVCEHLPRLAQCADKLAVVRGVSHSLAAHPLGQQYIATGNRPLPSLEFPTYGSVVSKELPAADDLPAFVSIPRTAHGPGYLGVQYSPLMTNSNPQPGRPFNVRGISLAGGVSLAEMEKRQNLLQDLDQTFRAIEKDSDLLQGMDRFDQQAFEMISSRRAREAFDISREQPSFARPFGEDPFGLGCLLAVRLVRAGVRFTQVDLGGWDTHQDNFSRLKDGLLPRLDVGLSALLTGLESEGLLATTTVFVTGEFGRTPKVNERSDPGGRDHYSRCMFMLLAGGGIRSGQVVGASDENAAGPLDREISPADVAATFYQALGIDPRREYETRTGRPVMIVREGEPIDELLA